MTATPAHTQLPSHVRLANDIAAQFHHRPPSAAATEIAAHLRSFWEPRMIAALLGHVESGGDGLDELAVMAAALMRPQLDRGARPWGG